MELNIHTETLAAVFALSVALGALTSRTGFCTMGALSDRINIGDLGRMRSWMLAIATALAGLVGLESAGVVDLSTTYPPYRTPQLAWLRYIVGGLLFGVGMTLASGCGNKTLVRIGGGNLKSLFVLAVGAVFAYLMIFTDFYASAFGWMNDWTLSLDARGIDSQALGSVVAAAVGGDAATLNRALAWIIAAALAVWAFASADFRRNIDHVAGGIGFGLAVLAGWLLTAGPRAGVEGVGRIRRRHAERRRRRRAARAPAPPMYRHMCSGSGRRGRVRQCAPSRCTSCLARSTVGTPPGTSGPHRAPQGGFSGRARNTGRAAACPALAGRRSTARLPQCPSTARRPASHPRPLPASRRSSGASPPAAARSRPAAAQPTRGRRSPPPAAPGPSAKPRRSCTSPKGRPQRSPGRLPRRGPRWRRP